MADKMAVMNNGFLQQYDTPANVFNNPVNMFVASFIGSPAMSLVPLKAVQHGSDIALASPEGWEMKLSAANATRVRKAKSDKIVVGARHSTIKLSHQQAEGSVPATVYTVEPTGDVTYVQVFLSGSPVNISLPPTVAIKPDERVFLSFDQEKLHLFDGETEMALTD